MVTPDDPTVRITADEPPEATQPLPVASSPDPPAGPTGPTGPVEPTESAEPSRGRRVVPYAIAVAIAAGVGGALVISALDDDPITSSGRTPVAVTGAPPTGLPSNRSTSPPRVDGNPEASVATLAGLLALLRADPDEFGPRGDDLRDRLEAISARGGLHPAERAALLADVREWTRNGDRSGRGDAGDDDDDDDDDD